MVAKYFSIIRNYLLSPFSQRKHTRTKDAFRTNSRNIIGRNPSMVIPLLANQDLTPMLYTISNKNVARFRQFISVKVKKILRKSQAQF